MMEYIRKIDEDSEKVNVSYKFLNKGKSRNDIPSYSDVSNQ